MRTSLSASDLEFRYFGGSLDLMSLEGWGELIGVISLNVLGLTWLYCRMRYIFKVTLLRRSW